MAREKSHRITLWVAQINPIADHVALVVLFLVAFGLRFYRLFELDFNFDEAVLLLQVEKSYAEILNLCKLDNFPPLYPWMLKLWGYFSLDDHWFRLFGALSGAMVAPVSYLLGREIMGRRLAWLLGFAAAVSYSLVFFSQIVRMFSIQPLFVALSLLFFIRALKTDRWTYWILTGLANLLGFYVYVFMVFFFLGEICVLIISFRNDSKKYLRPLIGNLPFFIGIATWVMPLISRYQQLQGNFWIEPFAPLDIVKMWVFLATGTNFRDHFVFTALLNAPFVGGYVLASFATMKGEPTRTVGVVLHLVVLIFFVISISGQSFFFRVYFLYILPLFLAFILSGWLTLRHHLARRLGLTATVFSLLFSISYYFSDYYELREYWGILRTGSSVEKSEGHVLSGMLREVRKVIQPNEVIIHYSNPGITFRSFFPSVYYDKREFPEYLYSKKMISQYTGRQYLEPGEWIRSLADIRPDPAGIWMISLNNTELFFDKEILSGEKRPHWVYEENLPSELREAGFEPVETIRKGKVSAIHYRRGALPSRENAVEP